ncbi:unnamed protein product [Bemisia tabaci]|uniref:NADH dehydrogenase [ubiquinone] 1 alpha subcomplex subunit 6 n=1 Tax=Bemisia tabaci TaxID=7038 RepID=A0A9N9ZYG7_BEMTA|nr:unnamed protein product [Bemisia tabaci]
MGSRQAAVKAGWKQAKPLISVSDRDCRTRALQLYKAWYRAFPEILRIQDLPVNLKQCREKLREEFHKNKNVTDLRVKDLLIVKGQQELQEFSKFWSQKSHMMMRFKETHNPQPQDFLSKFFSGHK